MTVARLFLSYLHSDQCKDEHRQRKEGEDRNGQPGENVHYGTVPVFPHDPPVIDQQALESVRADVVDAAQAGEPPTYRVLPGPVTE